MQKDTGAWTRRYIARERERVARAVAAKEAADGADPWPVGLPPEKCGTVVVVENDREPSADGWF